MKSIYNNSAICTNYIASKRSGMDHTVYLQIIPCLSFLRKRYSDGATPN